MPDHKPQPNNDEPGRASPAGDTRAQITYLNATTSPLLLLPPEVRNMIYTFVLDQGTIYVERTSYTLKYKQRFSINLLYVCRQIHVETALLPYKLNTFVFHRWPHQPKIRTFLAKRNQAQMEVLLKVKVAERKAYTATEWMKLGLV